MILDHRSGTSIGRFDTYLDAQRAVDRLADADDFDVGGVQIVANGLRVVEHVTGPRGWVNSLAAGAGTGALIGVFLTVFISLFSIIDSIGAYWAFISWGALLGALTGALLSGLEYWSHRGQRDFFSVSSLTADHYEIVVAPEQVERARQLLATIPLR